MNRYLLKSHHEAVSRGEGEVVVEERVAGDVDLRGQRALAIARHEEVERWG